MACKNFALKKQNLVLLSYLLYFGQVPHKKLKKRGLPMSESRSSKIRSSSAITLSELLAKSSITSAGKRRPLSCELDQSLSPSSSFEDLPEVDLEIDEVIGKGNYGSIARVHSSAGLNSSKTFVLKSVYDDRELVLETILARYIANNPDKLDNSVNIETPISVNNHLGLVSEEVPAGDLQNFLIKNVNTRVGDFSTEKIGKRLCQWIISMKNAQNNLHSLAFRYCSAKLFKR
jgi:hypothetical protein